MKLLNIGCGRVFHPDWVNIDIFSNPPHVEGVDIRKGLPFESATFDCVYSSHLLEHLSRVDCRKLVKESMRVLKPGGTMRIVVPDLEGIAKLYLERLNSAARGDKTAEADYDWMVLELIDQVGRGVSGGEMERFILDKGVSNKDFILSRGGSDVEEYFRVSEAKESKMGEKVRGLTPLSLIRKIREALSLVLVRIVGGAEASRAYREGLFRCSGQVHRWMYDRYSLKRLLEDEGLSSVEIMTPSSSSIEGFNEYELDTLNGRIRKPDSIFMEGIKG